MDTVNPVQPQRRIKFIPQGTPRQQDCWTRGIERQLHREAASLRRRATSLDRMSDHLEKRRLVGLAPTYALLWQIAVWGEGAGNFYIRKFAGIAQPCGDLPNQLLAITEPPARKLRDALSEAMSIARDYKTRLTDG